MQMDKELEQKRQFERAFKIGEIENFVQTVFKKRQVRSFSITLLHVGNQIRPDQESVLIYSH